MLRAISIHIPKTGFTSVRNVLHGNADLRFLYMPASCVDLDAGRVPTVVNFAHCTPDEILSTKCITQTRFHECFVFAGLRNPWDRLVSGFHNHVSASPYPEIADHYARFGNAFEPWAEWMVSSGERSPDVHGQWARPQSCWHLCCGQPAVDDVLRFEHITEDWSRIRDKLGITSDIGHANKSQHEHYRTYYSKRLAQCVGDFYSADCSLGNYSF